MINADSSIARNFDYNATACLSKKARDACLSAFECMSFVGNPSSVHQMGRRTRAGLEEARQIIATTLGLTSTHTVIFTSGATEANNMVLAGFNGPVLVSAVEHPSVLAARSNVTVAPVNADGTVDLSFVEMWLKDQSQPSLVSVMLANNETGVIQPVNLLSNLIRTHGAFFHTDAVQALGRIPIDVTLFDAISLSAHKIGGLMGTGCLIAKDDLPFTGMIHGGGQERSKRAGTENTLGALAFAVAIKESLSKERAAHWKDVEHLKQWMEAEILKISPDSIVFGAAAARLPNTTLISMPAVKSETQVMRFDLAGFCVSAGAACSSGKVKRSHVLSAMKVPAHQADTALRISLSYDSLRVDVENFVTEWENIYYSINNLKMTQLSEA